MGRMFQGAATSGVQTAPSNDGRDWKKTNKESRVRIRDKPLYRFHLMQTDALCDAVYPES